MSTTPLSVPVPYPHPFHPPHSPLAPQPCKNTKVHVYDVFSNIGLHTGLYNLTTKMLPGVIEKVTEQPAQPNVTP